MGDNEVYEQGDVNTDTCVMFFEESDESYIDDNICDMMDIILKTKQKKMSKKAMEEISRVKRKPRKTKCIKANKRRKSDRKRLKTTIIRKRRKSDRSQ